MEVKELVRFVKSLQFSWDKLRSGNEIIMGKLDIVYVFPNALRMGKNVKCLFLHIERNGFKFDPHPISCMLEMKETQIRHIFLKMNIKHFEIAKYQTKALWQAQ